VKNVKRNTVRCVFGEKGSIQHGRVGHPWGCSWVWGGGGRITIKSTKKAGQFGDLWWDHIA